MSYIDYSPLRDEERQEDEEEEDLNLSQHYNYRKSPLHRYVGLFKSKTTDLETAQPGRSSERRFSSFWPTQGTKKGLLMALGIGVILMVLVISAAVLVSSGANPSSSEQLLSDKNEKIAINDVLSGKYSQRTFNGTWISDDEIQFFNEFGDLVVYNVTDDTSNIIIKASVFLATLDGRRPFQCIFSPDREFILIGYDSQKVFRHSSNAKYEIYDTVKKTFQPLLPDPSNLSKRHLQLVEWSPHGNAIAYVFDNNIYYKPAANYDKSLQLTRDGSQYVFNGNTDWVYEEEMFGSSTAFWFSANGTYLAYVTFNDTLVDQMPITYYGDPGYLEYQYPMQENLPYPKSGRPNPTAVVTTVSLPVNSESLDAPLNSVTFMSYPGVPKEHLIGSVTWATDTELLVQAFNRVQNESRMSLCSVTTGCKNILNLQQPNGWVEVDTPKVSDNGTEYMILASQKQSKYNYRHILWFNKSGEKKAITAGDYSIESIVEWDEPNNRVFFTAPFYDPVTKEYIPSQSHLYYISDEGSNPTQPNCVTCGLKNSFNESCLANTIELSKETTYLVHSCSGPNVPEVTIRNLSTNQVTKTWVTNSDLRERLQFVAFPTTRNFDIPVGDGFTAKARLLIPPFFNASHKYPLFMDVYGGPGSAKINDRFTIDWAMSLVSTHNIIYASVDGRGSGKQSDDFMFQINRRLGTYEIEDQIAGAKWVMKNLDFIDSNRTAIWGWSYGGYATAMVMGTDTDGVFKCGISVAPVTNWLFYDTIYTERYMGLPTPEDNYKSYNISDVTHYIQNFHNKKFYLIHGNADDNVHYQQSMILSRALERADVLFRAQSYPDENHSLGGVRRHLYHSLEDFLFSQCF